MRRFRLSAGPQRETLETAARAFVAGFNAALAPEPAALAACLEQAGEPQRGHALEGAGMAATVLDLITAGRHRRLRKLLAGPGRGHPHLVLAGAGRAYASLRLRPSRLVRSLPADDSTHPALRWLAWDGYGFHRAFFASDQTIGAQRLPRRLTGALADEAGRWVADALGRLGQRAADPGGYLLWRQEIRDLWAGHRGPDFGAPADLDDDRADLPGWDEAPHVPAQPGSAAAWAEEAGR